MKRFSDGRVVHVFSPDHAPIGRVSPGESFAVRTRAPGIPDEIFERDYSDGNYPKRVLSITGPLYVEDCRAGDVARITVEAIDLDAEGKCWMGPWMGTLMRETPVPHLKRMPVGTDGVELFPGKVFPLRPMIGTLGVAPAAEVDCLYPGDYGGNMDCPSLTTGSVLYLRTNVDGALISVGDVHAAMGDGEVFGTGVEIGSTVTLRVDVVPFEGLQQPMVETADTFELIANHADLVVACRGATRAAAVFVQNRTGVAFAEAYAAVGMYGDLRICQIVNHIHTVRMVVPKALVG